MTQLKRGSLYFLSQTAFARTSARNSESLIQHQGSATLCWPHLDNPNGPACFLHWSHSIIMILPASTPHVGIHKLWLKHNSIFIPVFRSFSKMRKLQCSGDWLNNLRFLANTNMRRCVFQNKSKASRANPHRSPQEGASSSSGTCL